MIRIFKCRLLRKVFHKPARVDHGRMYMCCIFGLLLWSMSLLVIGPVPSSAIDELSDYVQNVLACCIFIGSVVCTFGIATGTRFFLPKADIRLSYKFALWGIPAIAGSIGTYIWAIVHDTGSFWVSTYAAAVGAGVCLGIIWNGLDLAFEIARLGEDIQYLKDGEPNDDEVVAED